MLNIKIILGKIQKKKSREKQSSWQVWPWPGKAERQQLNFFHLKLKRYFPSMSPPPGPVITLHEPHLFSAVYFFPFLPSTPTLLHYFLTVPPSLPFALSLSFPSFLIPLLSFHLTCLISSSDCRLSQGRRRWIIDRGGQDEKEVKPRREERARESWGRATGMKQVGERKRGVRERGIPRERWWKIGPQAILATMVEIRGTSVRM